jgi:hypothetical protein
MISDLDLEKAQHMIQKCQLPSSAMTLWTWGSNSNYLLGHGLTDSRTIPDQVALDQKSFHDISFQDLIYQDPQILQVVMSKYHVAVLTSSKLYTYGYSKPAR